MWLMGIGDEAGVNIESQIAALKELQWQHIEPRTVEVPGYPRGNFHDIPDPAFDAALARLEAAGIQVYCFGSTIMNWAKTLDTPWDVTLAEVRRAIPRMKRAGARYIRIMSFKPGDDEYSIPKKVFERVRDVTQMFLDQGLQPVHENCMNYGGMSWQHALELLDKCPGLKWVFDTANPILNPDRSKPKPWPRQDPWEFWEHIRDHVVHIHVKDATWVPERNDATYHWPGEGQGRVRDILRDALARGYDAGISIEPHMVAVFHDPKQAAANDEALRKNFVEYGRRLQTMLAELRQEIARSAGMPPA
ncbi:sugar phosphate isomerase/epimerase [Limisphaera ngatamarikiensis]|uniref:Sugar phosphate isomerase/epimerase n=1 Tax=Limisphaera ngatamarikiensis TaxID=1324935 RepID=A0A6M1RPD3_9BACT|nr:TIM barrel protein [Limisphaera ngatamarikiensis]NGO38535.1 sugar phosphate isomerase/epimerase [Limisphaera ngatamarikiensis]